MCHATQIDVTSEQEGVDVAQTAQAFGRETYVLARCTVGWPDGVETDLLRGLR